MPASYASAFPSHERANLRADPLPFCNDALDTTDRPGRLTHVESQAVELAGKALHLIRRAEVLAHAIRSAASIAFSYPATIKASAL